ncbi:hypothetical protein E2562_014308 [Oryza meyeriana var. granulata]|uniref:Uncharacterized protein n=1 Tax=Oryza meyeriana var. granulata TaxID=110450 RepID=A0A6G1C612_9ORYZ|nr:hypothetical protein E2562_014308 [Oryza meyeriana var. granulata]
MVGSMQATEEAATNVITLGRFIDVSACPGQSAATSLAGSFHGAATARKRTYREPKLRLEKEKPSAACGNDAFARGGVVQMVPLVSRWDTRTLDSGSTLKAQQPSAAEIS